MSFLIKLVGQVKTLNGESELNRLFESLPSGHPARVPYNLFKQASETVRGNVIIGLGSRLQVFQSEAIKKITARNADTPQPGSKNEKGEVYVSGFGWNLPSTVEQTEMDNDGDPNKMVGDM